MPLEGGNSSIMVGMFVCLCLASQKPSEWEFFILVRTDIGVELLTGIPLLGFGWEQRTPAPYDSYGRNSTESTVTLTQQSHKHHHRGGTVCPFSSYDVVSMDTPDRTQ